MVIKLKDKENQNRKGVKKTMKRLIAFCLIALLAASNSFLPYAQAANTSPAPYQRATTWIDYVWDGAGRLINQVQYNTTVGYTNVAGQSYAYKISSKITFRVINGEAYEETSRTVEERTSNDGKKTVITTDITKRLDENGRLLGATGHRSTKGWTAEVDENNDGTITPGEGRKYYEEEADLEFRVINGQVEVVKETATRYTYDNENKSNLISKTTSTTTRTYTIIKGVTKLVDAETTGKTVFYGQGTTDGQAVAADESNLPYTEFTSKTHYAYDDAGNILPMSGVERKQVGTDGQGNPIYKLYDSDGNEIVDANGDGSIVDETLAKMQGSYSVTYSSGVSKGSSGEWVVFTQTELTPYKVENGIAVPLWTYTEYSNQPLKPEAPANVHQDPIVQGRVVAIHRAESNANNAGQKNNAAWVIIRDGQGRLWAYRYFNGLSNIGDVKVGDMVEAQGNTMANQANIVEATTLLKKL